MKDDSIWDRFSSHDWREDLPGEILVYKCYSCNCIFKVQDLGFDYTEAIYCISCGKDTLKEIKYESNL
jgi:hypothetical protein